MRSMLVAVGMALLSGIALGSDSDSAIGNETVNADQASDKAVTTTSADAKEPEEFTPPAGFRAKKRGNKVVYCRKDMESGTRFASERCYDETQLKEIEKAREQDQINFDQARKICGNLDACGSG